MGMSTHIEAFIPDTDPEYQKHKKIVIACLEADVSLPKETSDYFFGYKLPTTRMLEEKLKIELKEGEHYVDWRDESSEGFEVDLTKLPKGVTKLRFYNNW